MSVPSHESQAVSGRILLVENASVLREIQVVLLRTSGYDVISCSEPEQALREVGQRQYEVMVLNSDHPAAYSREFLRSVRQTQPRLAILALVWNTDPQLAADLMRSGVAEVMDRPLNPGLLLQKIDALLGLQLRPSPPKHFLEAAPAGLSAADQRPGPADSGAPAPANPASARRDVPANTSVSSLPSNRAQFLSSFGAVRQVSSPSFRVTTFTR